MTDPFQFLHAEWPDVYEAATGAANEVRGARRLIWRSPLSPWQRNREVGIRRYEFLIPTSERTIPRCVSAEARTPSAR